MRKKTKKKKVNRGTLIILTGILFYFFYNFISLEIQYNTLEQQKKKLESELSLEISRQEQLYDELEQMSSDKYIEMLARKYFGLVYPQEKVIIEVEPD